MGALDEWEQEGMFQTEPPGTPAGAGEAAHGNTWCMGAAGGAGFRSLRRLRFGAVRFGAVRRQHVLGKAANRSTG